MRLLFFGTDQFAIPSLRAVAGSRHELLAVVTQPDRPAGRGQRAKMPPVKEVALAEGLSVIQPERVAEGDSVGRLGQLSPDLSVAVAYGQMLSGEVLSIPAKGSINLHPSLLPKYRGASPIQYAILKGERETGVTIIWMTEGMDDGDIILQETVPIEESDTKGSLEEKLAQRGADLLLRTLELIEQGKDERRPQDHQTATFAPSLEREDAQIDWSRSAGEVNNLIRAMNPRPGAFTYHQGKLLKIWEAEVWKKPAQKRGICGRVAETDSNCGFLVETGDGFLQVKRVQPESRKAMSGCDYVRGYSLTVDDRLAGAKRQRRTGGRDEVWWR